MPQSLSPPLLTALVPDESGQVDATTLPSLDEWFDQHKTECSVNRFDVLVNRYDDAHTRVVLVCQTCRGMIIGTIAGIAPTTFASLFEEVSPN